MHLIGALAIYRPGQMAYTQTDNGLGQLELVGGFFGQVSGRLVKSEGQPRTQGFSLCKRN